MPINSKVITPHTSFFFCKKKKEEEGGSEKYVFALILCGYVCENYVENNG